MKNNPTLIFAQEKDASKKRFDIARGSAMECAAALDFVSYYHERMGHIFVSTLFSESVRNQTQIYSDLV